MNRPIEYVELFYGSLSVLMNAVFMEACQINSATSLEVMAPFQTRISHIRLNCIYITSDFNTLICNEHYDAHVYMCTENVTYDPTWAVQ